MLFWEVYEYQSQGLCTSKSLQTSQSPVPSQCHHRATRTPLATELTPTGPALSVPLMRITESLLHKCPLSLCLLTQPALLEVLCNMSFLSGAAGNKLPCAVLALELLALSHVNNHASEASPVSSPTPSYTLSRQELLSQCQSPLMVI